MSDGAWLRRIIVEFQESARKAIPQIVALLNNGNQNVRRMCANALSKLSEEGRMSKFLV